MTGPEAARQMPRYKCHKEVFALKIKAIEFVNGRALITPANPDFLPFTTIRETYDNCFQQQGVSSDLGYYVVYDDGYESWSPSEAFEEGYTLMVPNNQGEGGL